MNPLSCHREEVTPLMLAMTSVDKVYSELSEITSWPPCFGLLLNIWKVEHPSLLAVS